MEAHGLNRDLSIGVFDQSRVVALSTAYLLRMMALRRDRPAFPLCELLIGLADHVVIETAARRWIAVSCPSDHIRRSALQNTRYVLGDDTAEAECLMISAR
jgi:hypothetical protein